MNNTKNVAVYVRQAIDNEQDFHHAMLNTEHIKKTAERIGRVVETYIDNRREKERPSWDGLMRDCRAGKIDVIVTRSISRLGCNTVDVLTKIRELRELGVQIYFEVERLYTDSDNFDKLASVVRSMAAASSTKGDGIR